LPNAPFGKTRALYNGRMKTKSSSTAIRLALTRQEAAAALGFKNAITLDRLVKRGLLHPSKATRRPLFPVAELERFLRETV